MSEGELAQLARELAQLARELADVLAKVVHEPEEAKRIATRAGVPVEHLPVFKTAATFWTEVVEQARCGRSDLVVLAQIAFEEFPHNSKLGELHEAIRASQPSPREREAAEAVLADHRARLVSELSPVTVLRHIFGNEAGLGQSHIRLEDVFVCPRLLPGQIQRELDALDQRLLTRDRQEETRDPEDRRDSARTGEHVRWSPDRYFGTPSMTVGRALRDHNRLLVVGDPGAGKSALLAALVLATELEPLSEALAGGSDGLVLHGRVPFFARLPDLMAGAADETPDIVTALADSIGAPIPTDRAKELVEHELRYERVIVVFDALDEVPKLEDRRRLAETIEGFARRFPNCLIVVSTRPNGQVLIHGFEPVVLPSMNPSGIRSFVSAWRKALGKKDDALDDDHIEALGELGRNPLMLLVMLLSGSLDLPMRERVLFYDQALRTMLSTWRGATTGDEERALRAWGEVAAELRQDGSGGVVPRQGLVRRLRQVLVADGIVEAGKALAEELVEDAIGRTGLVAKRGKELAFWHSTFGEYLAATALAQDETLDRFLALRSDLRNVEVAVMTIDHLAHVEGNEDRASQCLRALLEERDAWDDLDATQLGFAAECLLRGCFAQREDIDRCFEVVLRLSREFPYGGKHLTTFSRLVNGLPRHVPGAAITAELARVVAEEKPPVDIDDIAQLLARACLRQPMAVVACEALLRRSVSERDSFHTAPSIHRTYAALGLVASGRLEPDLLPYLVELPWFSESRRDLHRHHEVPLEPRADGTSFLGRLSRVLVSSRARLSTRWLTEMTDERQRRCVAPLLAIATGTTAPEAVVITSLLEAATGQTNDGVRKNARGILGRTALRHHTVRSELLQVALRTESSEDPPGRRLQTSEPANWAQSLLVEIASADPRGPMWLVDEVARAAFSSLIERTDTPALHFLRYILHERRDWYAFLIEAVRKRRAEPELWPQLAAFALLLGGDGFRIGVPDQEIWLVCVRSGDPWFRLVALEHWHPTPWPGDALADELIEAFVDACASLLANPSRERPPADERLAVLRRDTSSSLGARGAAEHWLQYAIEGNRAVTKQVIDAMRRRISESTTEQAVDLALILVEAGGDAEVSEAIDILQRHGLDSSEAENRARAALWLATHAQHSSAETKDELQLAMLGRSYQQSAEDFAKAIQSLGPPSNELIHRMVARERPLSDGVPPPGWLFSNPDALEILISYLRDDVSEDHYNGALGLLATDPRDEKITNAIRTRACVSNPDTCCRLALVLVRRLGERSSEDPHIDKLWSRALASSNHSNLYHALCNLPRTAWLGTDRAAARAAIRCLLESDYPTLRLLSTWLLLWHGEKHLGGSPTLHESLAAWSEAMDMSVQEVGASMVTCLDDPLPPVQLLAVCFLLGLAAAPESCKATLRQLMATEGEAATEPLFFWPIVLFSTLTIEGLLERSLRGVLQYPADVVRTKPHSSPNLRDVTEFLRWIYDDGAVPTRVDEILRGLRDPTNDEPPRMAVCLARSPMAKIRGPALLAIESAIDGERDSILNIYRHAVDLIDDPEQFETVMHWTTFVARSAGPMSVANTLHWCTKDEPSLRQQVLEWLQAAATAPEAREGLQHVEMCIHLMFQLDDLARRSEGSSPAEAPQSDAIDGPTTEFLRAHWREIPLSPKKLLALVSSPRVLNRNAYRGLHGEVIESLLQSSDQKTRALALRAWSASSDRRHARDIALQVWRETLEARGPRSLHQSWSIVAKFVTHDFTPADVLNFLHDCANDPELSISERTRVLSTLDRSPHECLWVEALGLQLLESSPDRDLREIVEWWVERQLSRDQDLPLPLIHSLLQMASSGWLPGALHRGRSPNDPRAVPLTNTPFDQSFAQAFAEQLHEDATSLRSLFASTRERLSTLDPAERDRILRTVRAQPTDDPTTRLARRWWHHQLRPQTA